MTQAALSCAEMLKVLADDTRLEVVRLLMSGPKHVNELNATLHVEPSLFSHHLKVLREGGIVNAERDGKAVLYSLAPAIQGRRTGNAINLGCCLISFPKGGSHGHAGMLRRRQLEFNARAVSGG